MGPWLANMPCAELDSTPAAGVLNWKMAGTVTSLHMHVGCWLNIHLQHDSLLSTWPFSMATCTKSTIAETTTLKSVPESTASEVCDLLAIDSIGKSLHSVKPMTKQLTLADQLESIRRMTIIK